MSTFDDPEHVRLGTCKLIEEVIIGEDKLIRFSGSVCNIKIKLMVFLVKQEHLNGNLLESSSW